MRDELQELLIISIHALREEGDGGFAIPFAIPFVFLSTPSVRRATNSPSTSCSSLPNFYPRPP